MKVSLLKKRLLDSKAHQWLLGWKPIHLCWWFIKHNRPIPKYLIGTSHTPILSATTVTNVASTSCTANSNITDGNSAVTRRGFCYVAGTSGDPTTANSVVYEDSADWGNGAYSLPITGLSVSTGYRVRAYAINVTGTGYATTVQLTTTAAISAKVMVDGAWKTVSSALVLVDGVWKTLSSIKTMVDGVWK